MTYEITNEDSSEFVDLNPREAYEQALNHLGFHLTYADGTPVLTDGDDVKEFSLIDSNDNSLVFKFFEGWYENACLKALTELGFSVVESAPENIIQFAL
jgi:hypothetical protein